MRYLEVQGARLSVIGLGTWQFGSREWGYGPSYQKEAARIVARALERGVTLFDTAEIYAFGRSERILGEALRARRDEAFVATKLFPVVPVGPVVRWRALASARRLGVDRIDLYQVHWPNPIVPESVVMAAMGGLVRSGLVRHVGVSNYGLDRWIEAEEALGAPVLSNQVSFSLVERGPQTELVPYASRRGRVVIAYSPLAQGLLSARYDADHRPRAMRALSPLFLPENLERARPLLEALRRIAKAHGATPAQVALAWVVRHDHVVAIPGASSVAQLDANVEAADLELSDAEAEELVAEATAFRAATGLAAAPGFARALLRRP